MAIIINADDFGLSGSVNAAICEAFEKGLINRTTLMSNMPAAEEAMELAKERGFADKVGIHLNITEGAPLYSKLAEDRVICDEKGQFTADFHKRTYSRFVLPRKTRQAIRLEFEKQIEAYKRLGGTLNHIDSHHHVHTDPAVLWALKPLIAKYEVSSIRLGRNLYVGGNPLMRAYKKWLNRKLNRYNVSRGDYFGSVTDFASYPDSESLVESNAVEIMVHPMYVDGELYDTDYPMSEMKKRLLGV